MTAKLSPTLSSTVPNCTRRKSMLEERQFHYRFMRCRENEIRIKLGEKASKPKITVIVWENKGKSEEKRKIKSRYLEERGKKHFRKKDYRWKITFNNFAS